MKRSPEDVVIYRDNQHLMLHQVFDSLNLNAYDLSIEYALINGIFCCFGAVTEHVRQHTRYARPL